MKNKFTFYILLIIVMISLSVIPGCRKKKAVLNPEDLGSDKEIYQKAIKLTKRDAEKARLLFKEIMHLYPDSMYARRAKIGIADSYYKQKDAASMIMAAAEYQEYVNLYPNSPDAVYAKFQIAMCYHRQLKKPGRDQTNTIEAIKALESMIKQYPDTKEADEAKIKIANARQNLAEHYYNIGTSNFKLKAYKGAITRFKQVIDEYPEFNHNDKLFFYTGKCYFVLKDYDSALSFFQKIINSFPKSKFIKKTKQMIEKTTAMQAMAKTKAESDKTKTNR